MRERDISITVGSSLEAVQNESLNFKLSDYAAKNKQNVVQKVVTTV